MPIFSYSQWVEQDSGVEVHLIDVFFIDQYHGWAVGYNSTIIHTKNAGQTWEQQNSPVSGLIFRKVYFIDENTGFIAGDKAILRTINAGETWFELNTGVPHNFIDLAYLNRNTLIAVGRWHGDGDASEAGGIVIRSTNMGKSWVEIIRTRWGEQPDRHFFTALQFINEQTGWMLGGTYFDNFNSTFLYETVDGGLNWNIISEIPFIVAELSAKSRVTFWVGGLGGAVSTNEGDTWERFDFSSTTDTIFMNPSGLISDFEQLSDYQMYVLVGKLGAIPTCLVHTTDAGKSWSIKSLPDSVNPMFALDKFRNKVWMVGKDGGIIYTDNILTSIINEYNDSNENSLKFLPYPNPFNSECRLKITSNKEEFITLSIFNMLGEKIVDIENDTRVLGEYTAIFNPESMSLAGGVYIGVLKTRENFTAVKLIYLK
ncbi:YCF48-related protein [Bacteroidota bacterium]